MKLRLCAKTPQNTARRPPAAALRYWFISPGLAARCPLRRRQRKPQQSPRNPALRETRQLKRRRGLQGAFIDRA